MNRLIEEASLHLTRALELEPALSPACAELLYSAKLSSGQSASITSRCLKMDPYSYEVVNAWKGSAELRWGGSEEEIEQIISHIDQHSDKNPALQSIKAMIAGDEYATLPRENLDAFLEPLLTTVKIAPTSGMFERLATAYAMKGNRKLSLAAQSQAVRFELGTIKARRSRMFSTLTTMPAWSLLDAEEQVRQYPNQAEYRIDRKLAEGFIALEKSGRLATMDKDRFSYSDAGIVGMESRNATIQDECFRFNVIGRPEDLGTGLLCEDRIVADAPTDPNAWRVRAEVMHYKGLESAALDAARKYLQLAIPTDPAYEMNRKRFERWFIKENE
jgi:tetratricopeptide (TPR) repeat protein